MNIKYKIYQYITKLTFQNKHTFNISFWHIQCVGTGLLITIKDLDFIRNLHYPSTPIGGKPCTRKCIFYTCYTATNSL